MQGIIAPYTSSSSSDVLRTMGVDAVWWRTTMNADGSHSEDAAGAYLVLQVVGNMDTYIVLPWSENAAGQGGNSLYAIGVGINATRFVSGAGEYSNVINGSWRGVNGKWNSLEWGGNQWTGARANALSKAGYFKLASRGFFYAGVLISGYQGFSAYQTGDYGGVAKSGFDIGMGAFATFGGPPGWIIGGGYFALDALGAFDRPMITTPYSPPMYAVPDNTYVAPPVIFSLRR